jgi:hypothetical protein
MEHVGSILVRLFGEKFDGYTAEFSKHSEFDEAPEAPVSGDNSGHGDGAGAGRSSILGQRGEDGGHGAK